jgi:hypothetical protein
MISVKIKKEDGTVINIHSNVDGRRLRELRKVKKKKTAAPKAAAPVVDNSPPMTIVELTSTKITLKMNYGKDLGGLNRED